MFLPHTWDVPWLRTFPSVKPVTALQQTHPYIPPASSWEVPGFPESIIPRGLPYKITRKEIW